MSAQATARIRSSAKERVSAAIADAARKLGYDGLQPNQELVVKSFLDVFVSMPTGSGKSLCYCLLPNVFDVVRGSRSVETHSVVIVVSPLVALMKKDQDSRLTSQVRVTSTWFVKDNTFHSAMETWRN